MWDIVFINDRFMERTLLGRMLRRTKTMARSMSMLVNTRRWSMLVSTVGSIGSMLGKECLYTRVWNIKAVCTLR